MFLWLKERCERDVTIDHILYILTSECDLCYALLHLRVREDCLTDLHHINGRKAQTKASAH